MSASVHVAIAYSSWNTCALLMMEAFTRYSSKLSLNNFLTCVISAPHLLRNAAASNVLTPVRFIKLFVSIIIPAYILFASVAEILISSAIYCNTSATISHAEDAYGSIYDNTVFSIPALPCL